MLQILRFSGPVHNMGIVRKIKKPGRMTRLCLTAYARRALAVKAEREGFEPPVPAKVRLISNQVHSTTLPPLLYPPKPFGRRRVASYTTSNQPFPQKRPSRSRLKILLKSKSSLAIRKCATPKQMDRKAFFGNGNPTFAVAVDPFFQIMCTSGVQVPVVTEKDVNVEKSGVFGCWFFGRSHGVGEFSLV
jgi:hypothetical protein